MEQLASVVAINLLLPATHPRQQQQMGAIRAIGGPVLRDCLRQQVVPGLESLQTFSLYNCGIGEEGTTALQAVQRPGYIHTQSFSCCGVYTNQASGT